MIQKFVASTIILSLLLGSFSLVLPNTARAQVSVPVTQIPGTADAASPLNTAANEASEIGIFEQIWNHLKQWAEKLLNESLKRQLLDFLVQQIINYINGGGDAKFVADWNTFLQGVAGSAIESFSTELLGFNLCSPFNIQLKLSLAPVQSFENRFTCTLDQVIANIEDFRNDFRNGSWLAYNQALQPNNNFYGAYLSVSLERAKAINTAEKGGVLEALAGAGFLGKKECEESSQTPGRDIDGDGRNNDDPRTCKTTTPGSTIGAAVAKAVGSDIDYLVNSEGLESYVSAIANAIFNRVLTEGLAAIQPDRSGIDGYVDVGRLRENSAKRFRDEKNSTIQLINEALRYRQNAQVVIDRASSTLSLANAETALSALIYLHTELRKITSNSDLKDRTNEICKAAFSTVAKIQNNALPRIEGRIFKVESAVLTTHIAIDDDPLVNPDATSEDNLDEIAYLQQTLAVLEGLLENNEENRNTLLDIRSDLGTRVAQDARKFKNEVDALGAILDDAFDFIDNFAERLDRCTTHPPTTPFSSATLPATPFPWNQ